ncbi:UxaA family hydrolase [Haloarcula nitratireducens]|uniref:UxaA family hydrolase n=1 Tax=Haloarcula nitratireducens TaxID=2487749 RepID=A0AAW4PER5_9EURY|nr:UxaA family hydrolase [Halomicroarcula nitratireducens]MBX0296439.1 UxaA family hydrolase [Halomicroarcula nitratireducens]
MPDRYLQVVEPTDNVATALRELEAGETVSVGVGDEERTVEIAEDVIFGHKIAIEDIASGETITKYGKSIGNATEDIPAGTWVHVHNVESNYGRGDLADDDQAKVISE